VTLLPLKNSPDFFIVDDDDADFLKHWGWWIDGHGYVRLLGTSSFLHRILTQAPDDVIVDHMNRNPLDNSRQNLRLCSQNQNSKNRRISKNNTSGYKGVSFKKDCGLWYAHIGFNGKRIHLGYFKTALEAADAYDASAIRFHGSFAATNQAGLAPTRAPIRYPDKRDTPHDLGQIPLGDGKFALVSPKDAERVNTHRWHLRPDGYVGASFGGEKWYLHRFITDCPKSLVVDHINKIRHDCRRENLRICHQTFNRFSAVKHPGNNPYRGVRKVGDRFSAHYKFHRKWVHVGTFRTAEDAAKARDEAVRMVAGDFGRSGLLSSLSSRNRLTQTL